MVEVFVGISGDNTSMSYHKGRPQAHEANKVHNGGDEARGAWVILYQPANRDVAPSAIRGYALPKDTKR